MHVGIHLGISRATDVSERLPEVANPPKSAEKGWKTLENGVDDLLGVGGIGEVPESALRRDDALGRCVSAAFSGETVGPWMPES